MSDDNDAPDVQEEDDAQAAVDAAHGSTHTFLGERLEAFSFEHQIVFERMGVRNGGSAVEAATAIVFLCTLGEKPCGLNYAGDPAKAGNGEVTGVEFMEAARGAGMRALRRAMGRWARKKGITINNREGQAALDVAAEIWAETKVSKFTPELPKARGKGGARAGRVVKRAR